MLWPGLDPQQQSQQLRELGTEFAERDHHVPRSRRAFSVRELPTTYSLESARQNYGALEADGELFVGIGGENVEPLTHNPRQHVSFIIAGPSRSGRSTALYQMATAALGQGYELTILAPRNSPVRDLAQNPLVKAVFTGTDISEDELSPRLLGSDRPRLLVADDAELLKDIDASQWLRQLVPQGLDMGLGFLLAGEKDGISSGFSGWVIEVCKSKRGVIFNPSEPADGMVVGVRITQSDVAAELPPGRGYTLDPNGRTTLVQFPQPLPLATASSVGREDVCGGEPCES